jgi:hypothetical protein
MRLEGHETLNLISAYVGLREIFSDYSRLAGQPHVTTRMRQYYVDLGNAFGAPLVPPRRLLEDAVDRLLSEGRGQDARRAYAELVSGYGAPADDAALMARIAEVEKGPKPAETVEGLLKTPFPSPEQARPFLGEWVGSLWMMRGQPRNNNVTLRIRVEGGLVIGETRHADAPPDRAGWIPVDYLRVTPEGLTWGRLNGMQPRGVMLWEGVLRGDTLSGKGRWGGIVVANPPGFDPGFSFVRVSK